MPRPPQPQSDFATSSVTPLDGAKSGDRIRILLVEDSPEYSLLVSEMLRNELGNRIAVSTVSSLADAHRALKGRSPDCVLLDLNLPDAAGLHGLAEITQAAPESPVVVLSGSEDEEVAIRAVQQGAQDYLVKRNADGQLLLRAIRYAVERKSAELDLARLAFHDPLTELPNRRLLIDRLERSLARVDRTGMPLALLFIDLDGFKRVNDRYGHEAGDSVLRMVADRLRAQVRSAETVARFGGDEFALLCDEVTTDAEVEAVAARVVSALTRPFVLDGEEIGLGASVGIAFGVDSAMGVDGLIHAADQAMFRAKERGASFEIAGRRPNRRFASRSELEAELGRAVDRQELALSYQPQVDLRSHSVFSVEALLRWRHPRRGLLGPSEFIPVAEESGLIVPIGEWVIERACDQLGEWRRQGGCPEDMSISINLSAAQLAAAPLVDKVREALARAALPPRSICLEVAERTVALEPGLAIETLGELRELGVKVALDDFGIGSSSLGALGGYPVDLLKIDRSFVSPLGSGLRAQRVFAAILGVAHAFELPVVAEGIETREQLTQIAGVGCEAGQGFLFARPAEAEEVAPTLRGTVGAPAG